MPLTQATLTLAAQIGESLARAKNLAESESATYSATISLIDQAVDQAHEDLTTIANA